MKTWKFLLGILIAVSWNAYAIEPVQMVIAHRGASGYVTENTLSAVRLGIEQKAHGIEIDIWRTVDDSIIVFHDRDTKRLAGDSIVIPESTYNQLLVLSLPGGEHIPTLREVLEILPGTTKVFIEIKCCNEQGKAGDVFPMVKEILIETKTQNQAVFISFNPLKLVDAKKQMPKVPCYWLTCQRESASGYLKVVEESGIEGINVHYSFASKDLVDAFKNKGLVFFVWTLDDPAIAETFFNEYGVDGITTNFPDRILKVICKSNPCVL